MAKDGRPKHGFFHKKTKTRGIWNRVRKIDLKWKPKITNFLNIKQESFNHFQALYSKDKDLKMDKSREFLSCIMLKVSNTDNQPFIKEINEFEVINVIWDLDPNNLLD